MHFFDEKIAKEYGVNCAIILQNLYYWIEHNKANGVNYHDGLYWTYNSNKAFQELFPYLTGRQISTAIKKLIDDDIIVTGNYNSIKYDRTMWYAITDKGIKIIKNCTDCKNVKWKLQKCQMEVAEMSNGSCENVTPIPYNNTDNNTDNNTYIKKERKKSNYDEILSDVDEELRDTYYEFIKMRKLAKAPMTDRALKLLIDKVNKLEPTNERRKKVLEQSIVNNWKSVYALKDSPEPQENIEKINGIYYIKKNGQYYEVNGHGIAVDPYRENELPY